ncbi:MAG: radical SAM protein [Firmicutes bacterium]|nr:radical SAM protein [Bacillota bacterium]
MKDPDYVRLFHQALRELFWNGLRLSRGRPRRALFFLRTLWRQERAARRRAAWRRRGVEVPPFLILSVTEQCNLHCQGCFTRARRGGRPEMTAERLRRLLAEAEELGVGIVLLAGGEPLLRPEVIELAAGFPRLVFPLFTNGLFLDRGLAERLARLENVAVVVSLEGGRTETERRRGRGVHEAIMEKMNLLATHGLFFGLSFTLTQRNWDEVTNEKSIAELIEAGCKLFFFIEYVPVEPGTEDLVLTAGERGEIARRLAVFRAERPAIFIDLPGDEERYGGCLAAGRGFVHVSADGRLEPCPFAPFSDVDLTATSLKDGLRSGLLAAIRANSRALTEAQGGCALWARREWVESLCAAGAAWDGGASAPD